MKFILCFYLHRMFDMLFSRFYVTSLQTLSLRVSVEDEFTYFADGNPLVTGAEVRVENQRREYSETRVINETGAVIITIYIYIYICIALMHRIWYITVRLYVFSYRFDKQIDSKTRVIWKCYNSWINIC